MKSPMLPVLQYIRRIKPEGANAWMQDANLLHRYSQEGDQSAFADLVVRHGPRVLAVCRRVLGNTHDAEDAFQVTFLLLARQAGGLRHPDRLASWLHGVALRTALKARGRRRRQFTLVDDLVAPCYPDDAVKDLKPLIDESIAALPGRYRDVIILCYLEGLSTAQAAKKIGCPIGTVSSRLGRAKLLLQSRLQRRGVVHPGATVIAALPSVLRESLVPHSLFQSTCALGLRLAATSVAVASLAKGVAMQMVLQKIVGPMVAVVGISGLSLGAFTYSGQAQNPPVARTASRSDEAPVPPPTTVATQPPAVLPPVSRDLPARELTKNFIVEAPTKRIANLIAKSAEQRRREGLTWLGKEQVDWDKPCSIKVTLTRDDIHNSASTFDFHQGKVSNTSVQLSGSLEHLLSCELPHELTHVILAHHFGGPIPRWADEGLAMVAEDDEDAVKQGLGVLMDGKRLIPLAKLLGDVNYPTDDFAAFYAQSRSLTAFLLTRMTPAKFLDFIQVGKVSNWDSACKIHANFADVTELEKAWLKSLNNKIVEATKEDGKKEKSPTNLPPDIIEALVSGEFLHLYFPVVYYQPVTEMLVHPGERSTPVTSYHRITGQRTESLKLKDIQAYRGNGKLIPAEDWQKTLTKRRVVLLSRQPTFLNPSYSEVLREDAIVLVLPGSKLTPELLNGMGQGIMAEYQRIIPPPPLDLAPQGTKPPPGPGRQ